MMLVEVSEWLSGACEMIQLVTASPAERVRVLCLMAAHNFVGRSLLVHSSFFRDTNHLHHPTPKPLIPHQWQCLVHLCAGPINESMETTQTTTQKLNLLTACKATKIFPTQHISSNNL